MASSRLLLRGLLLRLILLLRGLLSILAAVIVIVIAAITTKSVVLVTALVPIVVLRGVLGVCGSEVDLSVVDGSDTDFLNEVLSYCFFHEGNEAEAFALARGRVPNNLRCLDSAKVVFKVSSEVFLSEAIV
jgi:hypothetical protein